MTELPAGWEIEVKDQGTQIGEVWLIVRRPNGTGTTKVFTRDSPFGEAILDLELAQ